MLNSPVTSKLRPRSCESPRSNSHPLGQRCAPKRTPTVKFPLAKLCSVAILVFALGTLLGCATEPPVVYKDRVVEVPLPVRTPIDPRLTVDCEPRYDPPMSGPLPVDAALERL